jgi:hypothetical protein
VHKGLTPNIYDRRSVYLFLLRRMSLYFLALSLAIPISDCKVGVGLLTQVFEDINLMDGMM